MRTRSSTEFLILCEGEGWFLRVNNGILFYVCSASRGVDVQGIWGETASEGASIYPLAG